FDMEGSLVGTLLGPDEPSVVAWGIEFSPDGETVLVTYAAPEDNTYQRRAVTGAPAHPIPDGVTDIQIFDLATMSSILSLDTEHGWTHASYSQDGQTVAVSFDREVRLFDAVSGAETSRFEVAAR